MDQILRAITLQVHQLDLFACEAGKVGLLRNSHGLRKAAITEIRFIKPGAGLFGEDAGYSFAEQIDPEILPILDPEGRTGGVVFRNSSNCRIPNVLLVSEFYFREGLC